MMRVQDRRPFADAFLERREIKPGAPTKRLYLELRADWLAMERKTPTWPEFQFWLRHGISKEKDN